MPKLNFLRHSFGRIAAAGLSTALAVTALAALPSVASASHSQLAMIEDYSALNPNPVAADSTLECGPSTVRNELALLEEHGLLTHPHVSAGRVPTDAGCAKPVCCRTPDRDTAICLIQGAVPATSR